MKRYRRGLTFLLSLVVLLSFMLGAVNVAAEVADDSLETTASEANLTNQDIHLRDPYILIYEGRYYMYGTRADNCFTEPMDGFDCYVSDDLENWEGPYEIYHNNGSNRATWAYFAPECYYIDGQFYFFCSWREEGSRYEYENILVSDSPTGPFEIYAEDILEGIDATLYVEDDKYYILNRHNIGTEEEGVYASLLADDFKSIVGEPMLLFTVDGCEWVAETTRTTDGPCPYVTSTGKLLVMWSSHDVNGVYNIGIASSDNGRLDGNWTHEAEPFFDGNKGHNMLFTNLAGELMASLHSPNVLGEERPLFIYVEEVEGLDTLRPKNTSPVKLEDRFGTYTNEEIDIRDTYVLTHNGKYYLYGTEGSTAFSGTQNGFLVYEGDDLETWTGPYVVIPNGGWDGELRFDQRYWAPEVYEIDGTFYFFGGWSEAAMVPHTQSQRLCVLTSDNPLGPYEVLNADLGPGNDPTLYEEDGTYYLLYNDPWGNANTELGGIQEPGLMVHKLSTDFASFDGSRTKVFDKDTDGQLIEGLTGMDEGWETYVTPTGRVILMWSFTYRGGYCSNLVYFDDGILGAPTFNDQLFTPLNMGHNNFFESLDGKIMMGTHYPNGLGSGRNYGHPTFFNILYDDVQDTLVFDREDFEERFGDEYYEQWGEIDPYYQTDGPGLPEEPVKLEDRFGIYTNEEIDIRDTYVLTHDNRYYLFGTEGRNAFSGTPNGFLAYVGNDLETWEGPYQIYPNGGWDGTDWGNSNYWAPECYEIEGKFYFFTAWREVDADAGINTEQRLGVLVADNPLGPYEVLAYDMGPGNDPTLYQEDGEYYLIYNYPSYDYTSDNPLPMGMVISKLSTDFSSFVEDDEGNTAHLVIEFEGNPRTSPGLELTVTGWQEGWETHVTPTGRVIMMWSLTYEGFYASSLVYFDDGIVEDFATGSYKDYTFANEIFTPLNMGHNNFFEALDGQLMMGTHYNDRASGLTQTFPLFFKIDYDGENDTLVVDRTAFYEKYGEGYFAMVGDKDPNYQPDDSKSYSLSRDSLQITVSEQGEFEVDMGSKAVYATIESGDETIATVTPAELDENGGVVMVTGVAKGNADITMNFYTPASNENVPGGAPLTVTQIQTEDEEVTPAAQGQSAAVLAANEDAVAVEEINPDDTSNEDESTEKADNTDEEALSGQVLYNLANPQTEMMDADAEDMQEAEDSDESTDSVAIVAASAADISQYRYLGSLKLTVEVLDEDEIETVTISFIDRTNEITVEVRKGDRISTDDWPIPTRSGYTFDGWFDENGAEYTAQSTFGANLTLTARWTQIPVTRPGGGSSSGGGNGGSSGWSGPSTSWATGVAAAVRAATEVSQAAALEAVTNALTAGSASNVAVRLQNPGKIGLSTMQAMVALAGDTTLTIHADSMSGGAVDVRLYINPALATGEIQLAASSNSAIKDLFESWFSNKVMSVRLDQSGAFGQTVEVAAKLDTELATAEELVIYTYNSNSNTYRKLADQSYRVDSNGYVRFNVTDGGDYVISNGVLARK